MKKILFLLFILCMPSLVLAATDIRNTACTAAEEGYTACNLNGCYKCVSQVWTTQSLIFGETTQDCTSAYAGLIRWNGSTFQGCTGSMWMDFVSVDVDPATEPGTAGDASTVMLLHFEGTNGGTTITDSSAAANTISNVGVTANTSTYKFGGSSAYFNGSTYFSIPDSDTFKLEDKDFTIDFWIKSTSSTATYFFQTSYGDGYTFYSFLMNYPSAGYVQFYAGLSSSTQVRLTTTSTIIDGTWHHVAVVRNGSTISLYIDGNQQATSSISFAIDYLAGSPIYFGRNVTGSYYVSMYLDEFRISKGIARWTSNFTPPTAPY